MMALLNGLLWSLGLERIVEVGGEWRGVVEGCGVSQSVFEGCSRS